MHLEGHRATVTSTSRSSASTAWGDAPLATLNATGMPISPKNLKPPAMWRFVLTPHSLLIAHASNEHRVRVRRCRDRDGAVAW